MQEADERMLSLLAWMAEQPEGASQARICKRAGWSASELQRVLSELLPSPEQGGLGLIEPCPAQRSNSSLLRYRLTARGRQLFASAPQAGSGGGESGSGIEQRPAQRIAAGRSRGLQEAVAREVPVAMVYNDQPHAVMLASPTDLEDFALGFALAEGIVADRAEFRLVEIRPDDARGSGYSLHAHIPQHRFVALAERRRALSGRSGCGACGSELLAALDGGESRRVADTLRLDLSLLSKQFQRMAAQQGLNRASGGVHAAAWWAAETFLVREDIGRHNAVDKVIGAAMGGKQGDDSSAEHADQSACLLVTSRASYEIVHKAVQLGLEAVFAISAPTSLAIDMAERCGLTLGAFVREERCTIYTHPHRCSGISVRNPDSALNPEDKKHDGRR